MILSIAAVIVALVTMYLSRLNYSRYSCTQNSKLSKKNETTPATVTEHWILLLILGLVLKASNIGDPMNRNDLSSRTFLRTLDRRTVLSKSHSWPSVSVVVRSRAKPLL